MAMTKELLIHEVEYEKYVEPDRYGNTYEAAITLTNVRVDFASMFYRSGNGESIGFNALMFFDCVHSLPVGTTFTEKSKITFDGKEMVVNKVSTLYSLDRHHYEVELV